jgi:AcrR family transcriptional regulator
MVTEDSGEIKRVRGPQQRSARARTQILESALALFREKGFEDTTMREIAAHAGMAVGASYYYFKSKEEIVHEYYLMLEADAEAHTRALCSEIRNFRDRVRAAIEFKLRQLGPDRSLVKVLARIAADPDNPLSPFSRQTSEIRNRAITMVGLVCEGDGVQCSALVRPVLPRLVWLLYMGAIFFWIQDRSVNQSSTRTLVDLTTTLLEKVLWLSSLPLTGSINRLVVELVGTIFDSFEAQ